MCGSYAFATQFTLLGQYFGVEDDWKERPMSRYNIRPGQQAYIITRNSQNKAELALWGYVSPWEKDYTTGHKIINGRSETIFEKPMFKQAARNQRCVVPCTLFYEWAEVNDGKQPFAFRLKDQPVFGLAGLWQATTDAEGNHVKTFCILTTQPNELVGQVHNRMPCILSKNGQEEWLTTSLKDVEMLKALLDPYPSEAMESFAVSKLVNYPGNDTEEITEPIQV